MQGLVTISHAFCLGELPDAQLDGLLADMADLDVSVATVAPASPLPLERLTAAGIRVGLGEDGQRDYWSPYGNADMLDRTWQLAFTNRFRADELIEHCAAVATIGGASVIDPAAERLGSVADRPGLAVGDPAELVLLEGDTVAAAVMDKLPGRTVIHRGTVVADGLQLA
jgi:cytosine/adenosine deaminase-related metal-dependent hydrolase